MQISRYISLSTVSAWFGGKQTRTKRSIQIIIRAKRPTFLKIVQQAASWKTSHAQKQTTQNTNQLLKERRLN